MAYVSQEMKKRLAPAIKAVLKKHNMKGSIAVRHHSTLVVNIKEGAIPFDKEDHYRINEYHYERNYADNPKLVAFLNDLVPAMKGPDFFDESDAMTDYFHRSHYTDINFGKWNQSYQVVS